MKFTFFCSMILSTQSKNKIFLFSLSISFRFFTKINQVVHRFDDFSKPIHHLVLESNSQWYLLVDFLIKLSPLFARSLESIPALLDMFIKNFIVIKYILQSIGTIQNINHKKHLIDSQKFHNERKFIWHARY